MDLVRHWLVHRAWLAVNLCYFWGTAKSQESCTVYNTVQSVSGGWGGVGSFQ